MKIMRVGAAIAFILTAVLLDFRAAPIVIQEASLPFTCATFGPNVGEGDLKMRFGSANVTTGLVQWGGAEGDYNEGTILFADRSDARLEIYWQDGSAKRAPAWIGIHGASSRWRTSGGVMLGTDLKTAERLNARPFRLNGWGTDLGGGLYSWAGGLLARQDVEPCRIGFRFAAPEADKKLDVQALLRQVIGDRSYSSGHPAMQALNPRITEAVIVINRVGRNGAG